MIRQHYLRMEEADPNKGGGGGEPAPWFDTLPDPDLKSFYVNKGFKDVLTLADSYRQLEKTIGVPKERLVHLPENLDDFKAMEPIFGRLGRPEKADEYKITGTEGDNEISKFMRSSFHELGLTRKQGEGLAAKWDAYAKTQDEGFVTSQKTAFENEQKGLKTEWGAAHDQNLNIAKQAAAKFGVEAAIIDKLEKEVGYSKVMKLFHQIGTKIGEADFVGKEGGKAFGGVPTPEQANAKIAALREDKEWTKKFLAGDVAAAKEWNELHVYANPPPA